MILLATNALLRFLGRPDKLGPATSQALTASSEVRYSAITIAELRVDRPGALGVIHQASIPAPESRRAGFTPG